MSYEEKREKTNTEIWAEREVDLACKQERRLTENEGNDEWDYGCACYESALRALQSLADDGHSGFSIGLTKQILNRLIDHKPLTPIYDTPDVWTLCDRETMEEDGVTYLVYQCNRMSALFKYEYSDGRVRYRDIDNSVCINLKNGSAFHGGLCRRICDELWPVCMPYIPQDKPTYFYIGDEFLVDRKNGDYDTTWISHVVRPDGEKIKLNLYYKEVRGEEPHSYEWKQISRLEYLIRKLRRIR